MQFQPWQEDEPNTGWESAKRKQTKKKRSAGKRRRRKRLKYPSYSSDGNANDLMVDAISGGKTNVAYRMGSNINIKGFVPVRNFENKKRQTRLNSASFPDMPNNFILQMDVGNKKSAPANDVEKSNNQKNSIVNPGKMSPRFNNNFNYFTSPKKWIVNSAGKRRDRSLQSKILSPLGVRQGNAIGVKNALNANSSAANHSVFVDSSRPGTAASYAASIANSSWQVSRPSTRQNSRPSTSESLYTITGSTKNTRKASDALVEQDWFNVWQLFDNRRGISGANDDNVDLDNIITKLNLPRVNSATGSLYRPGNSKLSRSIKTSHCPSHDLHYRRSLSYEKLGVSKSSMFRHNLSSQVPGETQRKSTQSLFHINGVEKMDRNLKSPLDKVVMKKDEQQDESRDMDINAVHVKQEGIDDPEAIQEVQIIMADPEFDEEEKTPATWTIFPPPPTEVHKSNLSPWPSRVYKKENEAPTLQAVFGSSVMSSKELF